MLGSAAAHVEVIEKLQLLLVQCMADGSWGPLVVWRSPFWGQLSYVVYGALKIRYVDGAVYQGVRVAHLVGQERMVTVLYYHA
jgi:hypothetical protein